MLKIEYSENGPLEVVLIVIVKYVDVKGRVGMLPQNKKILVDREVIPYDGSMPHHL